MPRVRRPTSRLAQLLRLMRTGHPRRREAARLRRGLRLEALEKRELLTTILVNVRDDVPDGDIADGTVSLRDAVDRAPRGAIIAFAPHLDGATIALESFGFNGPDPQLEIRESLTIDASMLPQGITIRAYDPDRSVRGNGTRVFNVEDFNG